MENEIIQKEEEEQELYQEIENQLIIDLKSLTSTFPKKMVKTTDQISNAIATTELITSDDKIVQNVEEDTITVIKTKVSLTYEGLDDLDIEGGHKFTLFDKEVLDAVVSLYKEGNSSMTTSMVYRVMTGKSQGKYITKQQSEEISKSIDKCRFMNLKIDMTAESDATQKEISGNLIHADKAKLTYKGRQAEGYKIVSLPILYVYAASKNKISEIPLDVLDTPLNKSREVITFQSFFINKIEAAKGEDASQVEIFYDDIYSILEIKPQNREKKRTLRNAINEMLEYWKKQVKYIKGYKEISKANKKYKIIITLQPK